MSADEDTFDIDIYGEDTAPQESGDANGYQENGADQSYDQNYHYDPTHTDQQPTEQTDDPSAEQAVAGDEGTAQQPDQSATTATAPQYGTKRKAPPEEDDNDLYDGEADYDSYNHQAEPSIKTEPQIKTEPNDSRTSATPSTRPLSPNSTPALRLQNLDWWTTEDDLRAYLSRGGVEASSLRDVRIAEHNQNGKSKGEAYLELSTAQDASAVKHEIEKANREGQEGGGMKKAVIGVGYTGVGNPYKGAGEKFASASGRGDRGGRGAYNNYNNRGSFGGRGGGFQQGRGGGYGQQQGMYNQQNAHQQSPVNAGGGWGMNGNPNGNFNAAAGFGGNPMMGGMGFPNMGMGGMGWNGMGMNNQGGMMGMGRGGNMMGMGMGMPGMQRGGMMGGMGGMNGMGQMGRGGWGGQQGYGGGGGGMGGQGNKRQRNE
ncbi:uncharacterized protein LTR77_010018 [Saxophila tyrrhenica]|uniref:RRM domain-containing protein n=1 Tax=Saxophila tyrrhenica TaxID=1690608 RepID=A0AAV9NXB9_9PEZI|nr:hypothetical protein LTR77_010018 [Saxophila tyrrhenica]